MENKDLENQDVFNQESSDEQSSPLVLEEAVQIPKANKEHDAKSISSRSFQLFNRNYDGGKVSFVRILISSLFLTAVILAVALGIYFGLYQHSIREPRSCANSCSFNGTMIENCLFSSSVLSSTYFNNCPDALHAIYLNLDGSGFTSLPDSAFSGLPSLKILSLSNNNFGSNGVNFNAFLGLPSLMVLKLDSNGLTSIPSNSFSNLTSLVELHLRGNSFGDNIQPLAFHGLNNLNDLDLSYSGISSLPLNAFFSLTNLRYLWLNNNNYGASFSLSGAGTFNGLTNLYKLGLSSSNISSLPDHFFDSLTSLSTTNIRNKTLNIILGLPTPVKHVPGLALSGNLLSFYPFSIFSQLPKSGNGIVSIDANNSTVCPSNSNITFILNVVPSSGVITNETPYCQALMY